MELLKHVAKYHIKERDKKIKLQGEERAHNEAEKEDVRKDKPFVFPESMLV